MALVRSAKIKTGSHAENFTLPDTEGKLYSLADFRDKKGLVIVFTCNHCPFARAAWPKLITLYPKYGAEIGFAAINPNDAEKFPKDSYGEMQKKKAEWQIPFPYLHDATQETARAYDAVCTPDFYLFKNENGAFTLYYHGNVSEAPLQGLIKNDPPLEKQSPSMGCSIKWKA